MNIVIKVEAQLTKEEFEKGDTPETYTIIFQSKGEVFTSIAEKVREIAKN